MENPVTIILRGAIASICIAVLILLAGPPIARMKADAIKACGPAGWLRGGEIVYALGYCKRE